MVQLILDINILYIDLVSACLSIMSGLWIECKFVIRFDTWRWSGTVNCEEKEECDKKLIPNRLFENAKPNFISYLRSERICSRKNSFLFFGTIGMLFKHFKDLSPVLNYCDHCTQ